MSPVLNCAACNKLVPPHEVRYTMFLRSPQRYQGETVAHLCYECGKQSLKVFAASLRQTKSVTSNA